MMRKFILLLTIFLSLNSLSLLSGLGVGDYYPDLTEIKYPIKVDNHNRQIDRSRQRSYHTREIAHNSPKPKEPLESSFLEKKNDILPNKSSNLKYWLIGGTMFIIWNYLALKIAYGR